MKLDVTDAESLLFAKKPPLLDSNKGSDYQYARKQSDFAWLKTQESDPKNSNCTPCVLEVSPPSSVLLGKRDMGEPAQKLKKIFSTDPKTAFLGESLAEEEKTEINWSNCSANEIMPLNWTR